MGMARGPPGTRFTENKKIIALENHLTGRISWCHLHPGILITGFSQQITGFTVQIKYLYIYMYFILPKKSKATMTGRNPFDPKS